MIKIDNLSYAFPQKELYDQISFTIEEGQHCAFIGTNGSGKTSLIDLIMNPDNYLYEGTVEIEPNCRIGYVSQFSSLDEAGDTTVFDYIGEIFIQMQHEIASICSEMETASDIDPLLTAYQHVLDDFEAIGGDDFESNIRKKLGLANLSQHENLPISRLSSGEFKLVQVIKEMLTYPNLLIMDEPDVFLDFEHLNALMDLINAHKGALLVSTHNRYLLNHCFNKILHLENTKLQEFEGRYIDYTFSLLQTKIEQQELAAADTAEIERNNALIEKLRTAASNFAEASRGKTLNARIKIQERLEARRIQSPFVDIKEPNLYFTLAHEPEEDSILLEITDLSIAFKTPLLEHANFEMGATDKVALIGPNGSGKTTLLRELFKNENPFISIADDTKVAFLSQLQNETLDETLTITETFLEAGFNTLDEIKAHLIDFGFDETILNQPISALSGGEKTLLQLAKLAVTPANLLLLDEPTSHLDTYSQIALEKAINAYKGAVLMISHDFYSIVNCMDYVLTIENKTLRKMSMRKFRKTIYAHHFDKDYLELEQKKKALETRVELALKATQFTLAKKLSEELEPLTKLL